MKHIPVIILSLALLLSASTACGILQQDTSEVKVIPKSATAENISLNQSDSSKQQDSQKSQDNSLDDKRKSLQTNTENYIKETIENRAMEALSLIKSNDMEKLSQMVHPDKGVRFSPYGHVFTTTDLVFNTEQIKNIFSNKQNYKWGSYDGSGEPIELSFENYYKKFIYDADFITAKDIGYNKILGKGNIINNSFEVYPRGIIVEYHFSGFDPQYDGMDWKSLKLVFEKKDNTWYIVGIIHDQWTI